MRTVHTYNRRKVLQVSMFSVDESPRPGNELLRQLTTPNDTRHIHPCFYDFLKNICTHLFFSAICCPDRIPNPHFEWCVFLIAACNHDWLHNSLSLRDGDRTIERRYPSANYNDSYAPCFSSEVRARCVPVVLSTKREVSVSFASFPSWNLIVYCLRLISELAIYVTTCCFLSILAVFVATWRTSCQLGIVLADFLLVLCSINTYPCWSHVTQGY